MYFCAVNDGNGIIDHRMKTFQQRYLLGHQKHYYSMLKLREIKAVIEKKVEITFENIL